MDSIFAAYFVGPCIRIKLFGYYFGVCVESSGAVVDPSVADWLVLYFGPLGNTTVHWHQLSSYFSLLVLVGLIGFSVGYLIKKIRQNNSDDTNCNIQVVRSTYLSPLNIFQQTPSLLIISRIISLVALMLIFVIIFGPFIFPGIICGFFILTRYEIIFSIGASGGLVILYHFVNVGWNDNIELPDNILGMVLNWGVASVFFLAGFRMPKYFREGYATTGVSVNLGTRITRSRCNRL